MRNEQLDKKEGGPFLEVNFQMSDRVQMSSRRTYSLQNCVKDVFIMGLIIFSISKAIVWLFVSSLAFELSTALFKVRNSKASTNPGQNFTNKIMNEVSKLEEKDMRFLSNESVMQQRSLKFPFCKRFFLSSGMCSCCRLLSKNKTIKLL